MTEAQARPTGLLMAASCVPRMSFHSRQVGSTAKLTTPCHGHIKREVLALEREQA